MATPISRVTQRVDRGGAATMVLTGLLAAASYLFGQSMSIQLHWFWVALISLCIVSLSALQIIRLRGLQHRDDELRAIVDAVPHVVFFKDTQFRYQLFNAEFSCAFNLDPDASVGKTDRELFGPQLHERFVAQDRELMASGMARTYDEEFVIRGAMRNIQARKQPVYDRHGNLRGIVGVALDVTAEKAIQRQLEDANVRLGIALDAARMGFWEWNVATGEIRADARARQILGMKDSDHDIASVFARFHPDDLDEVRNRIDLGRARKEVANYEFRVIDDSGEVRWAEGFSSPDRVRASEDYLIGVNRDITERRQSELELSEAKLHADRVLAELEQSRIDLELALAIGGLGVWHSIIRLPKHADLTDPAFRETVIAADEKIREILGIGDHADEEAFTWRKLGTLVHPEDFQRVLAKLTQMFDERLEVYSEQYRVCRPSGVIRVIEVRGNMAVRDEADSVVIDFTGIAKDITDEEALKANLVTKAEEARAAVDAKAHFLAMMSHEVRTPLNGVLGMIDLVIDTSLTEDQRNMLMRCRESSVSLLTIINDILDFSKIEARMLALESRPLSLAGLVDDVCATFAAPTTRKAIGLEFHVDTAIPQYVVGDPVRLRQVLTNLIGNAVKFTQQGRVRVEARQTTSGLVELTVEDTGIGIDPRFTKSLFQPFKQADVATTRRYGGTGLGLSIVKQLVELMHGSVRCESTPGVGSRFIVTLPLRAWIPSVGPVPGRSAAPHAVVGAAKAGHDVAPGDLGYKVLLAEDHPINREVITRQLFKLGCACDCALDGQEAWEMLMAPGADYALLLTDCHMPRLDGYELTTRLRERESAQGLPGLPIIALTANALQGEAERCLALGMDAYLSKPLQLNDLRDALVTVMSQKPKQATGMTPGALDGAKPTQVAPYAQLSDLCGGDIGKVAELVGIFVAATEEDMKAMDRAAEADDYIKLRKLAHRLSSACHQLDEDDAVTAFQAVEHMRADDEAQLRMATREAYRSARDELVAVLARAAEFTRPPT